MIKIVRIIMIKMIMHNDIKKNDKEINNNNMI